MNKSFFSVLLTILLCSPIFSSDFSFEFEPFSGISYARFGEHIFSSKDDSICRSLLEWETKPLILFGASVKSGFKNFFLEIQGDFALPISCGTMRDSDWNESGDKKIIYSLLEEKIDTAFSARVAFSYSFEIEKTVRISPTFLADYSYIKILGSNGEGWFASSSYSSTGEDEEWNSGYARYYGKGKLHGINYERYSLNLFAGLKFGAKMTSKLYAELGFFLSPFTYAEIFDTHLTGKSISNYHLNQYAKSYFFAYKMSFSSCCDFTKILALNLSLNLTIQDVVKSPLYHNYYSSTPVKSNQKTGTNSISFTTKLGVKIKIL